jgi:hypothetical protein
LLLSFSCSDQKTAEAENELGTVVSPLVTANAGQAYISQCIAAGVPVPTTVLDSSWVNHGTFDQEFLSDELEAELWSWSPGNPRGLCLALPRWNKPGAATGEAELFGVICQGSDTSKVCFWDNSHSPKILEPKALAGNTGYPLSRFKGGTDLAVPAQFKVGGMCTDCHAGANAFIVHPEKPAFASMISRFDFTKRNTASGWYDPIVPAGWYDNKRKEKRLDAVASTKKCTSCHNSGSKAELPEISTTLMSGYCTFVLRKAVTRSTESMPPQYSVQPGLAYLDDRKLYDSTSLGPSGHISELLGYCSRPPPTAGGTVVPVEPGVDDVTFLSPPVVMSPIYTCGSSVGVRGAVPKANVKLTLTNRRTGSIQRLTAIAPEGSPFVSFAIPSGLDEDVFISATQDLGGVISAPSASVEVDDYPGTTLPTPVFAPDTIYACANTVSVRGTPNALMSLSKNGILWAVYSTPNGWVIASPGGVAPYVVGDKFAATDSLSCRSKGVDRSWSSATATASASATVLPLLKPAFEPAQTYEGQTLLGVRAVTLGAFSKMSLSAPSVLALGDTVAAPDGWGANFLVVPTPLGRAIRLGDKFTAEPSLYCPGVVGPPTTTPGARPCSQLPAPQIEAPRVGATTVTVIESMPGARIRITDATGIELADGTGPVLTLRRAVVLSDVLTASQQSGDCKGPFGFRIAARGD